MILYNSINIINFLFTNKLYLLLFHFKIIFLLFKIKV